jgi:hypothetical protein
LHGDDLIRDAEDLKKLRYMQEFRAVERLIARKKADLFDRWIESPEAMPADYCKGVRDVLDSLVSDVDATITAGEEEVKRRRELVSVLQPSGHGELAL